MPIKSYQLNQQIVYGESGNGNIYDVTSQTSRLRFEDYKNGTATPGYWTKVADRKFAKKKGPLAESSDLSCNAFTHIRTTYDHPYHSLLWKEGTKRITVFGCFGIPKVYWLQQPGYLPMAGHASVRNKAIQKFPAKLVGNSFNLPIFFDRLKKSVATITQTAEILAHKIDATVTRLQKKHGRVVNGQFVFHKRAEKYFERDMHLSLDNLWLQFRYSYRLTCKPIYDGLVAIHDTRSRGIKQRVSSRATETITNRFNEYYGNLGSLGGFHTPSGFDVSVVQTQLYEVSYVIWFKDNYPQMANLQQYGITNPAYFIYDKAKLSFVLDWFVNIGGYLSTLDAWLGKSFVKGTVSYVYEEKNTFQVSNPRRPKWNGIGSYSDLIAPPTTSTHRAYARMPLTDFPTQSLPTIDVRLNASRLTDAVALLLQHKRSVAKVSSN